MGDFAKLFRHPVVGQILVTREVDDDDAPYKIAVRFESNGASITPALEFKSEDQMNRAFEDLSESTACKLVDATLKSLGIAPR